MAKIRAPKSPKVVEFPHEKTGIGSPELPATITQFEARLCLWWWLATLWAVETNFDCGTTGSWETTALQYANYRIDELLKAGLIVQEDIDRISDQWDWPPFGPDEGESMIEFVDDEHAAAELEDS